MLDSTRILVPYWIVDDIQILIYTCESFDYFVIIHRYTWIKNGAPLNLNMPGITRLRDGTIAIEEASSRDQGYYQCQASNMYGKTMSMTYVLKRAVLDWASFETLTVSVTEGESIKLTANPPRCYPEPTYGWELATRKVDDRPTRLATNRRIQIDDDGELPINCRSFLIPW